VWIKRWIQVALNRGQINAVVFETGMVAITAMPSDVKKMVRKKLTGK